MPGEEFSLAELVQMGTRAALANVFKAAPGKVTAYDAVTNTAFVKPETSRALFSPGGKRTYEELPEIPFVPVIMPRAGGVVLRLPVSAGDYVLLVWCDVSVGEWRETGEASDPVDARLHGPGWPVAIPGFFPDVSPPSPLDAPDLLAGGAIFGKDGDPTDQMLIGGLFPGIRFGKLATIPIALATPITAALTAIQAALAAFQLGLGATPGTATAVAASATAVTAASTAGASTVVKSL